MSELLDLDAIEAGWAEAAEPDSSEIVAAEWAYDNAPALIAEVKWLREELAESVPLSEWRKKDTELAQAQAEIVRLHHGDIPWLLSRGYIKPDPQHKGFYYSTYMAPDGS